MLSIGIIAVSCLAGVLFIFDISFRVSTTVLIRATLNLFWLLHVPCLLVKIACISVRASVTVR